MSFSSGRRSSGSFYPNFDTRAEPMNRFTPSHYEPYERTANRSTSSYHNDSPPYGRNNRPPPPRNLDNGPSFAGNSRSSQGRQSYVDSGSSYSGNRGGDYRGSTYSPKGAGPSNWRARPGPPSPNWSRRGSDASRMRRPSVNSLREFEPSDAWKKNHSSSPSRSTASSPRSPRVSDDRYRGGRNYSRGSFRGNSRVRRDSMASQASSYRDRSLDRRSPPPRGRRGRSYSRSQSPRSSSRSKSSSRSYSPTRWKPSDSRRSRSRSRSKGRSGSRASSRSSIASSIASTRPPSPKPADPSSINASETDLAQLSLETKDAQTALPELQRQQGSSPTDSHGAPTTPLESGFMAIDSAISTSGEADMAEETPEDYYAGKVGIGTVVFEREDTPDSEPDLIPLPPLPRPRRRKAADEDGERPSLKPEDIPDLKKAQNVKDALKVVIMTRLLYDSQTRTDRVVPILDSNQLLNEDIQDNIDEDMKLDLADELVNEITKGDRLEIRMKSFSMIRGHLVEKMKSLEKVKEEKKEQLREEYLELHREWVVQSNKLDKVIKNTITAADIQQPPGGRTTRRSAAAGAMGDAARTELELEQIMTSIEAEGATDPEVLCTMNLATIPDMISATRGQVECVFDDTNHRVDNPPEYYEPDTGITDWTEGEKQIFLEKYALYPKQFGQIAEFLPDKTPAQCVEFYYLHKKRLIDFRRVIAQYAPAGKKRRRKAGKQRGKGILADIRQHDAEVHHRDITAGNASAAQASSSAAKGKGKGKGTPQIEPSGSLKGAALSLVAQDEDTPDITVNSGTSRALKLPKRSAAGKRLIPPSDPSSRRSSASVPPAGDVEEETSETEGRKPAKRPRRKSTKIKSAAFVDDDDNPTSDPPNPKSKSAAIRSRLDTAGNIWSEADRNLFLTLYRTHGPDFKKIADGMPSKTVAQVNQFYDAQADVLSLRSPTFLGGQMLAGVLTPEQARAYQQLYASNPGLVPVGYYPSGSGSPTLQLSPIPVTVGPTGAYPYGSFASGAVPQQFFPGVQPTNSFPYVSSRPS